MELYTVQIADNTLVTPRDGRIQYRVANVGEVLPAGGHVFAMLDTGYVYMDIYLPTNEAGEVKYGDEARIVVDAFPKSAIPARVTFIATQAQFTPKTVETQTEREKLMFRVRMRVDFRLAARTDRRREQWAARRRLRADRLHRELARQAASRRRAVSGGPSWASHVNPSHDLNNVTQLDGRVAARSTTSPSHCPPAAWSD